MQPRPGVRLGPYELIAPLGRGGMGEVFRARDTRLGRDVAIKFLSADLAGDPQALARFEREGRAVAALSHPNILALYDVGRDGDTAYVVTELLEGVTLRERLAQGPLPPRKALDYVRAVADAIAAAHSRGIIHRDLKPENVFVTTDGRVKVLDFGIAHMAAAPVSSSDGETVAGSSATAPGMMIGTVGYMAPEQVRGAATDPRTDVFALGALLYETLTGQAAFVRETPADTVSAILTTEPPELPQISTSAGPATEHVVRRCLEKEPGERFQSARDLSFALEALSAGTRHATTPAEPAIAPPRRARLLPFAAAAAAVAAIALAYAAGRSSAGQAPSGAVTLFSIPANIAAFDGASVSPDGQWVAYTGATTATSAGVGVSLRRLDSLEVRSLSETTAAMPPFVWAPDSRQFGYFVNTSLMVRELPDGAPRVLTELPGRPTGAAWGPQGVIILGTQTGLYRVSEAGGPLQELLRTDAKEIWRGLPSFLPGGDRFLYTALRAGAGEGALETRVASIDGRELGTVLTGVVGAMFSSGRLLFGLNGALYSQAFDTDSLKVTGERRLIAPSVSQNWRMGDIAARASDTGVLVYRSAPQTDDQFTWVDRTGRRLGTVGPPDSYTNFDVSPDGKRIAAGRRDPKTGVNSLALIDVERGVTTPISPRDEDDFDDPTWARDGRQIAYRRGDKLVMRLTNGGDERVLVDAEAYPDQFSADGRYLTYGRQRLGFYEPWVLDITDPGAKPIALAAGVTLADETRFSPNQKWIAYASNQSGSDQVWVMPFPANGEVWQISQAGGVQPRWGPDGNELFYLDAEGRVVSVTMPQSDPRRAGGATPLFSTGLVPSNALDQFAVVGDRFLVRLPSNIRSAISSPIEIMINWLTR